MRAFSLLPVVSILVAAGLAPGCRCNNSPAEPEPVAAPSAGPINCPAPPVWAEVTPDKGNLLVELVFQPETDAGRIGSGMRVFDDGRVQAFEEEHFNFKDGKLNKVTVDPVWRVWGTVSADRVAELKALIGQLDKEDLKAFQGKNRKNKGLANLLQIRLQDGAAPERSCYRGKEGSNAQRRVIELVQKLVSEAYQSTIAKANADDTYVPPPLSSAK